MSGSEGYRKGKITKEGNLIILQKTKKINKFIISTNISVHTKKCLVTIVRYNLLN